MKVQEIKYAGITSATSDYDCADGELSIAHNVVNENGAIRTVRDPETELIFDDEYTVLVLHRTDSYQHYIIRYENGTTSKLVWIECGLSQIASQSELIDGNHKLPSSDGINPTSIKAIGNSLVVLTDDDTHYYLWDINIGNYKYLGNKIPVLPLKFSQTLERTIDASLDHGTIDLSDIAGRELTWDNMVALNNGTMHGLALSDKEYIKRFSDAIHGVVNAQDANAADKNKFANPYMVRYALRLYDGSYILQSPPVFMTPTSIPAIIITQVNSGHETESNVHEIGFYSSRYYGTLQYDLLVNNALTEMRKWSDIVVAVDFFVTPPIYLYDYTGDIDSIWNITHYINDRPHIPFYAVGKEYPSGETYSYKGPNTFRDDPIAQISYNRNIELKQISPKEAEKIIVSESRFYKISSVTIDELPDATTEGAYPRDVPIKEGGLKNVVANESLEDGYNQMDYYRFYKAFVYNRRIVYAGATRVLRNEYKSGMFIEHTNDTLQGGGTYAFSLYVQYEGGTEYRQYTPTQYGAGLSPIPYIYIPDTRIKKIVVVFGANGLVYSKEFDAQKHWHMNGVYIFIGLQKLDEYIHQGAAPADVTSDPYMQKESSKILMSEVNNPFIINPQSIVTLDVSYILGIATTTKALSQGQFGQFPMYTFTDQGIWAMEVSSTGAIIAKQPISRDMVLGDGRSITQTDNAVLFASINGIQMIQGADVTNISKDIDPSDTYSYESMPGLANILSSQTLPTVPFATFINECRMVYDYRHRRVMVYNPSYNYAYLFSFDTMRWSTIASDFISDVNAYPKALATRKVNAFHILVDLTGETQDGEHFQTVYEDAEIEYEEEGETYTEEYNRTVKKIENFEPQGFLVTRPIKLQTHNLKTIRVTLQRGDFRNNTFTTEEEVRDSSEHHPDSINHSVPVTRTPHVLSILYGSRDLEHWFVVASSTNGNLRGFSGTPYKYFRIALLMDLRYSESVSGCTIQYEEKHTNQIR